MIRWFFALLLALPLTVPAASPPAVLVLGDSLSAAYGIASEDGWVYLMQNQLRADGFPHQVINASISGETTRGGLTRLPALLERDQPVAVVIALGSNDGLRGTPLAVMQRQLAAMIELAQHAGAKVLLVGNRLPPNYGAAYSDAFQQVFHELAAQYHVPLVPFMLEGIATDDTLLQSDRLHPTAAAEPILRDRIANALEPLLVAP